MALQRPRAGAHSSLDMQGPLGAHMAGDEDLHCGAGQIPEKPTRPRSAESPPRERPAVNARRSSPLELPCMPTLAPVVAENNLGFPRGSVPGRAARRPSGALSRADATSGAPQRPAVGGIDCDQPGSIETPASLDRDHSFSPIGGFSGASSLSTLDMTERVGSKRKSNSVVEFASPRHSF
jgi:hypothetical protein